MEKKETFFCNGCGHEIVNGEQLEIETTCRSKMCDHAAPEKCVRSIVYSHPVNDCFDLASARAADPSKGVVYGSR